MAHLCTQYCTIAQDRGGGGRSQAVWHPSAFSVDRTMIRGVSIARRSQTWVQVHRSISDDMVTAHGWRALSTHSVNAMMWSLKWLSREEQTWNGVDEGIWFFFERRNHGKELFLSSKLIIFLWSMLWCLNLYGGAQSLSISPVHSPFFHIIHIMSISDSPDWFYDLITRWSPHCSQALIPLCKSHNGLMLWALLFHFSSFLLSFWSQNWSIYIYTYINHVMCAYYVKVKLVLLVGDIIFL